MELGPGLEDLGPGFGPSSRGSDNNSVGLGRGGSAPVEGRGTGLMAPGLGRCLAGGVFSGESSLRQEGRLDLDKK